MRTKTLLLLAATSCSLPGCCSLSRLFCGPDRSPWVSQRFDTPQRAAQTLFEAIRRDEPEVVYLCLGEGYRRRQGLDSLTAQLAWARLREQNPGLHVAGYAEVPAARMQGPDRATLTVEVSGNRIELDLERQAYWEVRYRRPDGTPGEEGAAIPSFLGRARLQRIEDGDEDRSRLTLEPLVFHHDGIAHVDLDAVEHAALTRRWRIADLRVGPAP